MNNGNYYGGCDIGSTTGKAVIIDEDGRIISSSIIRSEIDPEITAKKVLALACERIENLETIDKLNNLVGTGYGRKEVPFAKENVSEISCHAMGVFCCNPEIRTIIDIGGQDVKSIALGDDGSILDFAMNDKCAAGTGRFIEMMSRIFNLDLEAFSDLSLKAKQTIPVTSQCSVFAETEVISLLSKRKSPSDIAAGIQASVAKRCFGLVKKVGIKPKITITGGCAKNRGLLKSISKRFRSEIFELDVDPQLIGAFGAAIFARKNA